MSRVIQNLKEIKLNMFHQKKKVFSGPIEDLPKLKTNDQKVDSVNFLNAQGSMVMSMKYHDFEKMFADEF